MLHFVPCESSEIRSCGCYCLRYGKQFKGAMKVHLKKIEIHRKGLKNAINTKTHAETQRWAASCCFLNLHFKMLFVFSSHWVIKTIMHTFPTVATRGQNNFMFEPLNSPLIPPLSCFFNVTVSIMVDLSSSRGSIHVTQHVIPIEFLKQAVNKCDLSPDARDETIHSGGKTPQSSLVPQCVASGRLCAEGVDCLETTVLIKIEILKKMLCWGFISSCNHWTEK